MAFRVKVVDDAMMSLANDRGEKGRAREHDARSIAGAGRSCLHEYISVHLSSFVLSTSLDALLVLAASIGHMLSCLAGRIRML